jgi:predicted short-subunit dehydrogenase-like oxidoreductase (DUF2520 family)
MGQAISSTIGFIGAGRVGKALAWSLSEQGYQVGAVASRRRESAEQLAARIAGCRVCATPQEVADQAGLIFLTTTDAMIAPLAAEIAWRPGTAVVHCSGATEITVLQPAAERGASIGGLHPFQTISDPEVAIRSLHGATITVEAAEPLLSVLSTMARQIGGRLISLPPGSRALYHASGHYVGPFVLALLCEALALWEQFGVSREDALASLMPLLKGSINSFEHDGLVRAMAGPIARGDIDTVRKHLADIGRLSPAMAHLYAHMAILTLPLALQRGSLSPATAAEFRQLFEDVLARPVS